MQNGVRMLKMSRKLLTRTPGTRSHELTSASHTPATRRHKPAVAPRGAWLHFGSVPRSLCRTDRCEACRSDTCTNLAYKRQAFGSSLVLIKFQIFSFSQKLTHTHIYLVISRDRVVLGDAREDSGRGISRGNEFGCVR